MRGIAALTMAALLTGAAGVSAQIYAPQTLERYFRLEWDVTRGRKGPVVEGYVYNTGWVPMDGRAYFRASVRRGQLPRAGAHIRLGPQWWWRRRRGVSQSTDRSDSLRGRARAPDVRARLR